MEKHDVEKAAANDPPAGPTILVDRAIRKDCLEDGMKLHEAMTVNPQTISSDATAREAALLMKEHNVGILPVLESGRAIGVVTDRDLAIRALAVSSDPSHVPISEVMTPEILWMYEDEFLDDAIEAMSDKKISRLLVKSRSGEMVGILSAADVAALSTRKRAGDLMNVLGGSYRHNHISAVAACMIQDSPREANCEVSRK